MNMFFRFGLARMSLFVSTSIDSSNARCANGLFARSSCLLILFVLSIFNFGCHTCRLTYLRHVPDGAADRRLNPDDIDKYQASEQTLLALRTYSLDKLLQNEPIRVLNELDKLIYENPDPDLLSAFSEVAYRVGVFQEYVNPRFALELYVASATYSYRYLFDPKFENVRNPYDPQFRDICGLYNAALEKVIRLVSTDGDIPLAPGNEYSVIATGGNEWKIRCEMVSGIWSEEEIASFKFAHDYEVRGLNNEYRQRGLGVPLIAERKKGLIDSPAAKYYPYNLSFPVTVLLRPVLKNPELWNRDKEELHAILEFYDPLVSSSAQIGDRYVPLESDLTTPLAYMLSDPRVPAWAILGFVRPELFLYPMLAESEKDGNGQDHAPEKRDGEIVQVSYNGPTDTGGARPISGIYMVQPYEKGKIPVVLVHGLWSTPMTWMEMFNTLRSIPEIREKYQFWFYFYATGEPFWISAAKLREDLEQLRNDIDPWRRETSLNETVLIGHSMGGLLSMLQTIESEDRFWRLVSDVPFESARGMDRETRENVRKWLFFRPNPSIRRVITIATPHRGSDMANGFTQWLARSVIKLPQSITESVNVFKQENESHIKDKAFIKTRTSVDSLASKSPFFPVMLSSPHAPWVKYNNIVGVNNDNKPLNRIVLGLGDGVVQYESARLSNVESQEIVQEEHSSVHMHPKSILEVRRILLEHIEDMREEKFQMLSNQIPVYAPPPQPIAIPEPLEQPGNWPPPPE